MPRVTLESLPESISVFELAEWNAGDILCQTCGSVTVEIDESASDIDREQYRFCPACARRVELYYATYVRFRDSCNHCGQGISE